VTKSAWLDTSFKIGIQRDRGDKGRAGRRHSRNLFSGRREAGKESARKNDRFSVRVKKRVFQKREREEEDESKGSPCPHREWGGPNIASKKELAYPPIVIGTIEWLKGEGYGRWLSETV